MTNPASSSSYFNLHTFALGYVEDIRLVTVKRGSFVACRMTTLRGEGESRPARFDLKVVGAHAKACMMALKPMSDAKKTIIAHVKISDVYPELFPFKNGPRAGEFGVNIKGRVLKVYMAKVDGQDIDLPPMPYTDTPSKQPPVGLVTSGVGYLNRVKQVHVGEGEHIWMASVAALRGDPVEGGKVETTRFVLAVGPDALVPAQALQDALLAKKKVLVGFDASGIRAELFQYESGEKKGQTDAVLKGALSRIAWAKVDGEEFPFAEKAA